VNRELRTVNREPMWVPALFREEYEFGIPTSSRFASASQYESIFCEAKYTNFRRFATSARIK
jgi:hypothetical protein